MSTFRRAETGSFNVVDDNGREETVYECTIFEETIRPDGTRERTDVGKGYSLKKGHDVNVTPDGLIVEVATGRKLRRV